MTMSRIVVAAAVLWMAMPAMAQIFDTLDTYRKLTSVEPRCSRPASGRELLVCGARRADRWRVPYVGYDVGDPRGESVDSERKRIADDHRMPCGVRAIIADCGGGVGVKVSTAFGASGSELRLRPLAP